MKKRSQVVPAADGRALEIDFGSGTNLPCYNLNRVKQLFALEPSPGMRPQH